MDGATAFLLIERHANNWQETGAMMEAWRRAAVADAAMRCVEIVRQWEYSGTYISDAIKAEFPEAWK